MKAFHVIQDQNEINFPIDSNLPFNCKILKIEQKHIFEFVVNVKEMSVCQKEIAS